MSLDVDAPPPPELDAIDDADEEYHRADIEAYLADGAWEEAFGEWARATDLDETEFAVIEDLGLIEQFDFFWDDFVSRVGYSAPGIPEDWRERDIHPDLDAWETVSGINAALAELGRITSAVLTDEYADWGSDDDIGEDLPDFE